MTKRQGVSCHAAYAAKAPSVSGDVYAAWVEDVEDVNVSDVFELQGSVMKAIKVEGRTIIPEQVGVQCLCAAMIERAVRDLTLEQELARTARVWLEAEDSQAMLKFVECCEVLDLNAQVLRRRIFDALQNNQVPTKRGGRQRGAGATANSSDETGNCCDG